VTYQEGSVKSFASLILSAVLFAATPTPDPYAVPPDCARYFPVSVCRDGPAIARWLPRFGDAWQALREGQSTTIAIFDSFAYRPKTRSLPSLRTGGPTDGTFFTYGIAGPPKGYVIYDRRHKIAFYHEGCCSWGTTVIASGVAPPPRNVVDRDLSRLQTNYGVRLGESPSHVKRIFGGATLWNIPERPGFQRLSYRANFPTPKPPFHNACGISYQFVFHRQQLVFIELLGGC